MPRSELACPAGGPQCAPQPIRQRGHTDQQPFAPDSAQHQASTAYRAAAGKVSGPSRPSASIEPNAGAPCACQIEPAAPSLQSWCGCVNDQCALASQSASLDTSSVYGPSSPTRAGAAHPAGSRGALEPAERASGQARGGAKLVEPHRSEDSNAPAFWEGRRGSSSSSGHVHGSSAALSALAQAYSRQGSPDAAQSAQDAWIMASERSPLETSQLLRAMAAKIDIRNSFEELASSSKAQAEAAAQEPAQGSGSKSETPGGRKRQGAQQRTAFNDLSSGQPGPTANPFARASEDAGKELHLQPRELRWRAAPGNGAGSGQLAEPAKSVAALSMCCEAGSCVPFARQGSVSRDERSAEQGLGAAHSSEECRTGRRESYNARCAIIQTHMHAQNLTALSEGDAIMQQAALGRPFTDLPMLEPLTGVAPCG